ncbi:MAG: internal scaffolding protein [Microvirus sp.]|nr:MAG: internal scaffolding protein [Microvirus sp.]
MVEAVDADGVVLEFNNWSVRDPRRRAVRWFPEGPSMTRQAEAEACDINNIMARYQKTGVIDHLNRFQGEYADVAAYGSFQESLELVERARAAFMTLPSSVRAEFGNDPGRFLDFAQDPANLDKMIEMGLAPAKAVKDGSPVVAPDKGPPSGGGA